MCNTCCNFDEWESYETHFKVPLLSLFYSFNFMLPLLSFLSSIKASSSSFLSKAILGGEAPSSLAYSLVDGASPLIFSFAFRCISRVKNHHWNTSLKLKDPSSIEAPQTSFHHNISLGCPIWVHNISRRSKLNNGSSREIPKVITFNSDVRFISIIYRDARNWTTEALEKFKWSKLSHGCPIRGHNISRRSKLNNRTYREIQNGHDFSLGCSI